jgi:Porin PorA
LAVLALLWAPGVVKKTPLDVDKTTVYEGEAAKIDSATGNFDHRPVYALTYTKADSEKSSDDHVLMVETSCAVFDTGGARECVNGNDPDLITASIDIFATDRETAMLVDDDELPPDAVVGEGLMNKFPFDVEKKPYPFWDGTIGRAVDIEFDGTEELFGLETYRFTYTVEDEPIEVAEGVDGTYTNTVTVNVDPVTGSIVRSGQDQQRYLEDGTQVLDIAVIGTEDTVRDAVDEAKDNGRLLTLLLTGVPIIGFVGGGLCLLAGFLLLRRPPEDGTPAADREAETVSV